MSAEPHTRPGLPGRPAEPATTAETAPVCTHWAQCARVAPRSSTPGRGCSITSGTRSPNAPRRWRGPQAHPG
eukprot:5783803-Lingulodinium_polyedra.AAC.1